MFLKPVTTEKAISGIELRNTLTFLADAGAKKPDIKKQVEAEYGAKVLRVNTSITPKGRKKAFVVLREKGKAADIAARLKLV